MLAGNDWREMTEIALFGPSASRKRTISRSQGSLIKSDDVCVVDLCNLADLANDKQVVHRR